MNSLGGYMKYLLIAVLTTLVVANSAFSKDVAYPRQKISLAGELLSTAPKTISVKELESFKKPISIKIFDPYNLNIETEFYGFYLTDFVKAYGKETFKILRVTAIDGYSVDIPKADIAAGNLFMSYKNKAGYLTVDHMGPARIIAPVKGIINKDLLLKIGVYWVWQVKSIEFVK